MADETGIFAEAELRENRLIAQLTASPIVDVLGVVDSKGACGYQRSDGLWTLNAAFAAWRIAGATLYTQPLRIRRKVTHEELDRLRELISAYHVLRIKAHVVIESLVGSPEALLVGVVGIDASDAELNSHADELQKPVTFDDAILGTFTLDRRIGWFSAETVWNGDVIILNLLPRELADLHDVVKIAHALWQDQPGWDERIRDCAVQELLSIKNAFWLEEGEATVTAEQFKDSMILDSVTVNPDGSFAFWHNDGDLFWGHAIEVTGTLHDGPTNAGLQG